MHSDELWAITSYFNPSRYRRRLENFQNFRKALHAPLIVAEMSESEGFEVPSDDQTIVVRLTGADVMWQKEALLNVALEHLPVTAKYVAWLDCDVLFERADWLQAAKEALSQRLLIQLFTDLHDLPPSGAADPLPPLTGRSIAALEAKGDYPDTAFRPTETIHMRRSAFGLAWAAQAELMRTHRFYDAMIIGSGDRALACAALGRWQDASQSLKLLPARVAHYEAWAKPFHQAVRGNIGVLSGRLFHLWHGDIANRAYAERHHRFAELPFDPSVDLVRAPNGLWKWARNRSDVADFMANYFAARQEDGHAAT